MAMREARRHLVGEGGHEDKALVSLRAAFSFRKVSECEPDFFAVVPGQIPHAYPMSSLRLNTGVAYRSTAHVLFKSSKQLNQRRRGDPV